MFISHEVSLEVVQSRRSLVSLLEREDRDLADHITRAASSVVLISPKGSG